MKCWRAPAVHSLQDTGGEDEAAGSSTAAVESSSDDGPTQRASGSCGTRLSLIFCFEKALVPAFHDERRPFRGSKTAEVPLIASLLQAVLPALGTSHRVHIRNQEGKQLATKK
jgi:hypothetical protein